MWNTGIYKIRLPIMGHDEDWPFIFVFFFLFWLQLTLVYFTGYMYIIRMFKRKEVDKSLMSNPVRFEEARLMYSICGSRIKDPFEYG